MKRNFSLLFLCILIVIVAAGSNSKKQTWTLDKKHAPLPDYVLNSSEKIQETYVMAAKYPGVLSKVPCYCGCGTEAGHDSNMNCYIDKLGKNNAVEQWDSMSIS